MVHPPDHETRARALEAVRRKLGVEALLLTDPADIRWACGFTGSNALLLCAPSGWTFVTDGRYGEQAREEVRGATVAVPGYDLAGFLAGGTAISGAIALASDRVTVEQMERFRGLKPDIEWRGVSGMLAGVRASKSSEEVGRIEQSQRVTEQVLAEIVDLARPGLSEREVAAEITGRLLRHGAERPAFDPIVAAGERSALPHARPTDRLIRTGEPVLLDFGAIVDGYASDMTRMLHVGSPDGSFAEVHALVVGAMEAAEPLLEPGTPCSRVDAAARDRIAEAGFGERFPHSLGHGVGLDVHEQPTVSWRTDDPLPCGAVVTVEPGVYLPGRFGVRVEDMIHVSASGPVRLTSVPRDLIII